jgi:membrane protease YdiL (CAAX protease family)
VIKNGRKNPKALVEYLALTAILIFSGLTPYKLAGMLIIIAYLIAEKIIRKRKGSVEVFRFKEIPKGIKDTWVFIVLVVVVSPLIFIMIGKLFVPEYFTHVLDRAAPYVDVNSIDNLTIQLLVLAFGEEIVFRVFLQGKLTQFIRPSYAIILSSVVFAGLHYSDGIFMVVILDLLSVFADSILFGIIYHKSSNVYVSTIAHFSANLLSMILLVFFI